MSETTENWKRVQRERAEHRVNQDRQEIRGFFEKIMTRAERETGRTREDLIAEAERRSSELPPPPKLERSVMVNRRVPEIHIRHVFDQEPIDCDALDAVRAFIDSGKTELVILGSVGTRKSGSAAWALSKRPGYYVDAGELHSLSMAKAEDIRQVWDMVRRVQLLVVDDLGSEFDDGKGWGVQTIEKLLNARYNNCVQTIFTSNLSWSRILEKYGERVADRIRETGRVVELAGDSARRRT